MTSSVIIVSGIQLNRIILGPKDIAKNERSALYRIKKSGSGIFSSSSTLEQVDKLKDDWKVSAANAVTAVRTSHAAVNGMLNDLQKASWLMGVHASHAYADDNFGEYTLFHNPSESALPDFYECVSDNLGITTSNAKQLASILLDIQKKGQPVKWVVHSQGGIIFKQALSYHLKRFPGQPLNKNTVVFHSGGNNKKMTDRLLIKTGIQKASADNDNPFDLVPNIAGANHLGLSALKRSIQFSRKVAGKDVSNPTESPHTLPFMGLSSYHRFLTLAGDNKSAERVQKYMNKLARSSSR
ncbi:hypothetical protein [Teredinibacter haidensis]|uniref:hypothetical protein n=1 Tax=Teredinibacter haidensis TaxID=2731755 RepID=UPI0009491929|nr:hypothetical protein [Teredinibacter haidensis]